jgi:hypothetical protein
MEGNLLKNIPVGISGGIGGWIKIKGRNSLG